MGHPCASSNPPSWCNKKKGSLSGTSKRSRKGKPKKGVTPAAFRFNPEDWRLSSAKECLNKKKQTKKGCIRGRGKNKGKIFKKKKGR
jgi:hypothetical protein